MTESVLKNAHRVVVKVGSALVTNDGRGLDFEAIARWATQIAALQKAGCDSQMVIAPERWHAYVLYYLSENMSDFDTINTFLTRVLSPAKKLRWMRLDMRRKFTRRPSGADGRLFRPPPR